jgi:hypothetical protein
MKRIKVDNYEIEKSNMSAGFHLYKNVPVEKVDKNRKKTGEVVYELRTEGYDMSLKTIAKVIAEESAFLDSDSLIGVINALDAKYTHVFLEVEKQISKLTKN